MAAVDQKLETDLTQCPVCYELLKSPKSLPCLHSFCEECLVKYITSLCNTTTTGGIPPVEFTCPLCRKRVPSLDFKDPKEWAHSLPTDPLILTLLQKQNRTTNALCNICEKEKVKVEGWCVECKASLCHNCIQHHNQFPLLQTHRVLAFEEIQDIPTINVNFCIIHSKKKVKMFCVDHDRPCCTTCVIQNHRACQDIKTIEEVVAEINIQKDVGELSDLLKSTLQEIDKLLIDRKQTAESLYEQKDKIEEEITKLRQRVNKHLDNIEEAIRTDVAILHKRKTVELEKQIEDLENERKVVSNCQKTLELSPNHVTDLQLFLQSNKIAHMHRKQVRSLKLLKKQMTNLEYRMSEEPTFTDFASKFPKLGSVIVAELPISGLLRYDLHLCKAQLIKKLRPFPKRSCLFKGVAVLPDDRFVTADGRNQCLDIYKNFNHEWTKVLDGNPFDITLLNKHTVAVSIPDTSEIQIINLEKRTTLKSFKTDQPCYGISSFEEGLVVVCEKSLRILDLNGNMKNSLTIVGGKERYVCALDVGRIYYTSGNVVHCITVQGDEIFQFKSDEQLYGVAVDSEYNAYVVQYSDSFSGTIIQLNEKGKLIKTIVSNIQRPQSLDFEKKSNRLLATFYEDEIMLHELRRE